MNLRSVLDEVRNEHGKLTPQTVLESARDPEHPLHSRFEWDDSVAAEAWRQHQAHRLIRLAYVVYKPTADSRDKHIRAFHAVRSESPDNGGFVYEPLEDIIQDDLKRQIVLRDMERDWVNLKGRYSDFIEFWHLLRDELKEGVA